VALADAALAGCSSFVLALYACVFARSFAERRALLDRPNERSLHQTPTPRLGGVAIVLAVTLVTTTCWATSSVPRDLALWLVAALVVAALGLLDDLRPLPAAVRLSVQLAIAAGVCAFAPPPARIAVSPSLSLALPLPLTAAGAALGIAAVLNIYNFMDGMDGLAGAQAIGAAFSIGLAAIATDNRDVALVCLVIAAAAAGFLVHNAPPAKLFMGDAGSTFLGFGFAAISVIGLRRATPLPLSAMVFGLAPFLFDGLFTLLRRSSRGEKIWQAHRTHLYQRAVATGLPHHAVLVPYCAWITIGVAATALDLATSGAFTLAIGAGLALVFIAVWAWVRRREQRSVHSPASQLTAVSR
jgi:UDP-N-acetylmuramyl pentapeptide phosphotransferase/UDP-N-acetylglucosamine-1-phosphate transferase